MSELMGAADAVASRAGVADPLGAGAVVKSRPSSSLSMIRRLLPFMGVAGAVRKAGVVASFVVAGNHNDVKLSVLHESGYW